MIRGGGRDLAQHVVAFTSRPEVVDATKKITHVDGVLRLRKIDFSGDYNPRGHYELGRLTIDAWAPKALSALNGFMADADVDPLDQLLFRLSPDAGATELWWDGAAWITATDPAVHWNTEDVIDAHIAVFPIQVGITQIVRFVSGNGKTTPVLRETVIFYEARYESTLDLVDSLARALASNLRVMGVYQATLVAQSTLTVEDPIWTVNDTVRVFNHSTDPNHRTNVFASRVGNVLTLTAPQTGEMIVEYAGSLDLKKIHVATDVFNGTAELPAIVIQTPSAMRVRHEATPPDTEEEPLRSRSVSRLRKSPTFQDVSIVIQCNAAFDLHARKLRDAVKDYLESIDVLRSRALDEPIVRLSIGPVSQAPDLGEQTYTFNVPAVFSVVDWPTNYREAPVVEEVLLKTSVVSHTVDE